MATGKNNRRRSAGENVFTNPREEAQRIRDLISKPHTARTSDAQPLSRSEMMDEQFGPIEPSIKPTATIEPRDKRAQMNEWGAKGRTAAAGYQPASQRMRVWWGDGGTAYDYFNITPQEWHSFAQQAAMPNGSPGRWINQVGNMHEYGKVNG